MMIEKALAGDVLTLNITIIKPILYKCYCTMIDITSLNGDYILAFSSGYAFASEAYHV